MPEIIIRIEQTKDGHVYAYYGNEKIGEVLRFNDPVILDEALRELRTFILGSKDFKGSNLGDAFKILAKQTLALLLAYLTVEDM